MVEEPTSCSCFGSTSPRELAPSCTHTLGECLPRPGQHQGGGGQTLVISRTVMRVTSNHLLFSIAPVCKSVLFHLPVKNHFTLWGSKTLMKEMVFSIDRSIYMHLCHFLRCRYFDLQISNINRIVLAIEKQPGVLLIPLKRQTVSPGG